MNTAYTTTLLIGIGILASVDSVNAGLRAGAARVDISPPELPVLINGGMLSRSADEVHKPVYARGVVLTDNAMRIALVVVDSCMMPRDLLDSTKRQAAESTGIRPDRILISATHAHSVPSCMGALGTAADENYPGFLEAKLVETIERAADDLEPAEVGAAVRQAPDYTAVRRWIRRPDRKLQDPFGNSTVRANMHPGYQSPDATGPSGPADPDLAVLSIRSLDERPIALIANFSMHYFSGVPAIHPDYFGLFADHIQHHLGSNEAESPAFVAMMSQGPSGDTWRRDYLRPEPAESSTISDYTEGLAEIALKAYEQIEHRQDVPLAMAEAKLPLQYRIPDEQRLAWAKRLVKEMGDRPPENKPEVYAREQLFLHERQETELILQALRIGEVGITAIPNEVYALTGLKIKAQSPLEPTINIELANGAEGYIAPPEQHPLGGYTTWPARTAGLEIDAEPKIVETVLGLLERVADRPRQDPTPSSGPTTETILNSKPTAYWRLDEMSGPWAFDAAGRHHGLYEPGVAFYLKGPRPDAFRSNGGLNRSPHFAGGRMRTHLPELGDQWSLSLWFWNGMPLDAREVTGWLFSRGREYATGNSAERLGIDGTAGQPGRVIFKAGLKDKPLVGDTPIERWNWHHVLLVRDEQRIRVYLDGQQEIHGTLPPDSSPSDPECFIGGGSTNAANFEGRIDEVAIYDRPLTESEIRAHYPGE